MWPDNFYKVSPLPVGRVDLSVVASGTSHSGFAIASVDIFACSSPIMNCDGLRIPGTQALRRRMQAMPEGCACWSRGVPFPADCGSLPSVRRSTPLSARGGLFRPLALPGYKAGNRDRGSSHLLSPPTPPDKRVRIRRFEKLRSTETRDSQFVGPS